MGQTVSIRKKAFRTKKREQIQLPHYKHYPSHALSIRISISMVVQSVSSMLATGQDVMLVAPGLVLMLVADVMLALTVGAMVLSSVVIMVLFSPYF